MKVPHLWLTFPKAPLPRVATGEFWEDTNIQIEEHFLLWLTPEMSPKSSSGEGLVPSSAVFRGGAFERWLDRDGSDIKNGLVHLWIYNLVGY
jgi:hypothetical protein